MTEEDKNKRKWFVLKTNRSPPLLEEMKIADDYPPNPVERIVERIKEDSPEQPCIYCKGHMRSKEITVNNDEKAVAKENAYVADKRLSGCYKNADETTK